MSLRLSPEDQEEYNRRCAVNQAAKEEAIRQGDAKAAKRARQANTALYQEFERRQLPPPPPTEWEREMAMTLEQRIERIEEHLGIGRFA